MMPIIVTFRETTGEPYATRSMNNVPRRGDWIELDLRGVGTSVYVVDRVLWSVPQREEIEVSVFLREIEAIDG